MDKLTIAVRSINGQANDSRALTSKVDGLSVWRFELAVWRCELAVWTFKSSTAELTSKVNGFTLSNADLLEKVDKFGASNSEMSSTLQRASLFRLDATTWLQHTESALLGSIQEHSMRCNGAWISMTLNYSLVASRNKLATDYNSSHDELRPRHCPLIKWLQSKPDMKLSYDALTMIFNSSKD